MSGRPYSVLGWLREARRGAVAACLAAAVVLIALPGSARAGSYVLDFDSQAHGTVVSSGPGGLGLAGSPVVFSAGSLAGSAPNALRRPGSCPDSGASCTSGDHQLAMTFPNRARTVSMRVGFPATAFPSPSLPCGSEFGCFARLVGFDAGGAVVAITPWTEIGPSMTAVLRIDAGSHVIARAVYSVDVDPVSGSPFYSGAPQHTAQVDDLAYNVLESGDPPPPPPPPAAGPTVNIRDPTSGQAFASTDVSVRGTLSAAAGLSDTCVAANSSTPASSFPLDCTQSLSVTGSAFSSSRIPGIGPGANDIRVWVRDTRGRVASDAVAVSVADGDVDFATESLEVTQAIQVLELPAAGDSLLSLPGLPPSPAVAYDGVPLSHDKTTVVRLYASANGASGPVRGATALLWGFAGGEPLPGSPLRPHFSPRALEADPDLAKLRADEEGSFNFLLPSTWRERGRVTLVGEVAPPSVSVPEEECCDANNRLALSGVPFTPTHAVEVYPVSLRDEGETPAVPSLPLAPYFEDMQAMWPGRVLVHLTTPAEIDVTDTADRVREDDGNFHEAMNGRLLDEFPLSLPLHGKVVGLLAVGDSCAGEGPGPTAALTCPEKGMLVAHETGHAFGLAHGHSGDSCEDDDEDGSFDGPVSGRGRILGVGLDPRLWGPGDTVGVFKLIAAEQSGVFDAPSDEHAEVYDYMSYCSKKDDYAHSWVSTGYWATTLRGLSPGVAPEAALIRDYRPGCCFLGAAEDPTVLRASAARSSASRPGSILQVSALLYPGAGPHRLLRVERAAGRARDHLAGAGGPGVEIVVKSVDGAVISATEVDSQLSTEDEVPSQLIRADVRSAPRAGEVEIRRDGVLLAERIASASAPRAGLHRPRPGTRVRSSGRVAVRWRASDADGDDLTSRIEFSADGGRAWRTLASGLVGNRARIAGADLARTPRGVLRVVVSDGFNVATARAGRIRAAGIRPQATIATPAGRRLTVLGDTMVTLQGQAFDDHGRRLRGRRLVWTSKGRRIGRGESADVPAYRLGRRVTLTARDRSGRRGTDAVRLRVRKVAPVLTTLRAGRLSRAARRLRLQVAASLPARVRVSGRGVKRQFVKVGPKRSHLILKLVGKRRDNYRLRLQVSAAGRASSTALDVTRRASSSA